MAPGSVTSTTTIDNDPSHYLSSSISSLSSQRAQSSWLAKTYRRASQLYLTKRLPEALDAIEPAVFPENVLAGNNSTAYNDEAKSIAPVSQSTKGTRVKIWSFYLTLLNTIIELGPEEGKSSLGGPRYNTIVKKAQTGSIWDEVLRHGYRGADGQMDGEVVANLSTLLLSHMTDQKLNQQRLETYLSACMHPSFDIAAHMEASRNGRPLPHRADSDGTSTPRDLNTRLKLLELYTLHVLPRNEQWEYAHDFISMSEVLDEERRDAFLGALQQLKEEKSHDAIREAELRKRHEDESERQRLEESQRRREELEQMERQRQLNRSALERKPSPALQEEKSGHQVRTRTNVAKNPAHKTNLPARPNRGPGRGRTHPLTLYQRLSLMLSSLQAGVMSATRTAQGNPLAALRYLFFLFAFVVAFARRDVRQRLRRMFQQGMVKVQQTIGMGTKVSFL